MFIKPVPRQWLIIILLILSARNGYAAKTVTDPVGRTVTIPDNPVRIVSLAPNVTETIYELDQQHRLVGATQFSNFPKDATRLPRVGSYVRLDLERIMALKPDLCIAIKNGNPIAIINRLEELGIPVFAIDPRTISSVMESVKAIGTILNAGKEADAVLSKMQGRLDHIKQKISGIRTRPRVFMQISTSPLFSVGPNTLADEMIALGGGQNVVRGTVSYPMFSKEQVLDLAPEVFIITTMDPDKPVKEFVAEWEEWPEMPAVRNHRIYPINSDLTSRPTPRMILGLECIAAAIHPELFDKEMMNCR